MGGGLGWDHLFSYLQKSNKPALDAREVSDLVE
jgi:hypothetical protein